MYYAFIKDNKIDGVGQVECLNPEILCVEITEEVYNNIDQYIWDGLDIILNPDYANILLEKAKENKIAENDIARDAALNSGVVYEDVLFDSDTDQKVNLLAIVSTMGDEETIIWFGMDNIPLECNKLDLINIGGLITQLHTFCWGKNAEIKAEIANAETVGEVEAIEINYATNN